MPARPELVCPDDAAIAAAARCTLRALATLFQVLGTGEHTLSLAVDRTDDVMIPARADISLGDAPVRLAVLDEDEFQALCTLVTFALEGSTVRRAVLVATTAAEPTPRACAWTVRDGWLRPMDTAELELAVHPCPGLPDVHREVYPAPVLTQHPDNDEESPRA
ncbi:hypothetical protein AB0D47_36445 [Streptomyces sp. NPDC048376]|uniref:hypothetical protein n=1 Tax=Streptomyces TaxID=1883 RepID=UPI002F90B6A2